MKGSIVTRASAGLVSLLLLALGFSTAMAESTYPVAARAIPTSSILPNQKISPIPKFIGKTATAKPVTVNIPVPQRPLMAENPWNCMHNDSYQSDVYPGPGPLGSNPVVSSTWLGPPDGIQAIVVGMTFDKTNDLLIAASIKVLREKGIAFVQLTLIDAKTLATLARFNLPGTGFRPAGAYFYMAEDNRIVIGTKDRTIWLVSCSFDDHKKLWSFQHENEAVPWDLSAHLPEGDSIKAPQPPIPGTSRPLILKPGKPCGRFLSAWESSTTIITLERTWAPMERYM